MERSMPKQFMAGLERFQREHFPRFREDYQRLVSDGQHPSTLFIGCSDSRVVPDLLMGSRPGELFIIRNIGNLIPPYEANGYHGTPAGIEYAVLVLGVTDIVVCGHTHCGAIRSLYTPAPAEAPNIARWLELGEEAKLDEPVSEEMLRRSEQRSIVVQLKRLMSYPMVSDRVAAGTLHVHGWYYVIEEGLVKILDVELGEFVPAPAK
jgi:carbonic anhydrase